MHRRTFLTGAATATAAITAGCLGAGEEAPPEYEADDHESHGDAFREELTSRDVEVNDLLFDPEELEVTVDYEHPEPQQGLAEVAMAFVERIQGGWGVDRLEAVGRGEAAMSWHAKTEWAEQYLDEEIDAEEYGGKINDTVEHMLLGGDGDDGSDGVGSDGD